MNLTIRDYLCKEANRMIEKSLSKEVIAHWNTQRPKRLLQYWETLGVREFMEEKRSKLNVHVTKTLDRTGYRIENLYYESFSNIFATASLYTPTPDNEGGYLPPYPAIIYFCGHTRKPRYYYQAHARRFAQLGFVVLILDTVMFGEVAGVHWGPCRNGMWNWTSKGYNPAAIELINGVRGIDLLYDLKEVDSANIGVTGISGGGTMSWWIGSADQRVTALASVCGTGTNASQIIDRTLDTQCDCMVYPNTDGWDIIDVYALMSPRPALIVAPVYDDCYAKDSLKVVYDKLKPLYAAYSAESNLELIQPYGHHDYQRLARLRIFSFFLKHLKGLEVNPEDIYDIDQSPQAQEKEESFHVYQGNPPLGNLVPSIHNTFIQVANPPIINNIQELEVERSRVIKDLKEKTFAAFPQPVPLDTKIELEWGYGEQRLIQRLSFTSEVGLRLHAQLEYPEGRGLSEDGSYPNTSEPVQNAPLLLYLRLPEEVRWFGEGFIGGFLRGPGRDWLHCYLETRGTGETAWGRDMHWHVRRALPLIGRTVASMRIYDTLRAIEALQSFKRINLEQITLVAPLEMGVIALYAALLNDKVRAVVLNAPPSSHDLLGATDGTDPAIELLQVLRITDLPQVAGLLYPKELIFVGDTPKSYEWTEKLYAKLGSPGRIHKVSKLDEWIPSLVKLG